MKQFTKCILLASLFILSGCATKVIEKTITIERNTYKAVTVSEVYLQPCEKPSIFSKDEYLNSKEDEKRTMLVNAVADRNDAIDACNRKIESIGKESKKLEAIINARKDDPVITESIREYTEKK